jgi:hypothetical protein
MERKIAKGFELARIVLVGAVRAGPHGAMDEDQYFPRKPWQIVKERVSFLYVIVRRDAWPISPLDFQSTTAV